MHSTRSGPSVTKQTSPKRLPVRRRKSATKQEPERAKRWPANAGLPRAPARGGRCLPAAFPVLVLGALAGPAAAQAPSGQAAPLLSPRPVFVPGLYETESRNSRFRDQGVTSRVCFPSADYEAFRRETLAQYETNPEFLEGCRLSDSRELPDGFAFAMDCKGSKIVLTFHFGKDSVSSTTRTLITDRPEYSSEILTLSHRVGDCPGQAPGKGT